MSVRILLLFSILLSVISHALSDLCLANAAAGTGCATTIQWRDNLVCRILGGENDDTGSRERGYLVDTLDIQQNDNFADTKRRLRAGVSKTCELQENPFT